MDYGVYFFTASLLIIFLRVIVSSISILFSGLMTGIRIFIEQNKSKKSLHPEEYYKDLLNKYTIPEINYLLYGMSNVKDMINATIISLSQRGIITISYNGKISRVKDKFKTISSAENKILSICEKDYDYKSDLINNDEVELENAIEEGLSSKGIEIKVSKKFDMKAIPYKTFFLLFALEIGLQISKYFILIDSLYANLTTNIFIVYMIYIICFGIYSKERKYSYNYILTHDGVELKVKLDVLREYFKDLYLAKTKSYSFVFSNESIPYIIMLGLKEYMDKDSLKAIELLNLHPDFIAKPNKSHKKLLITMWLFVTAGYLFVSIADNNFDFYNLFLLLFMLIVMIFNMRFVITRKYKYIVDLAISTLFVLGAIFISKDNNIIISIYNIFSYPILMIIGWISVEN